jgi:membrane protein required for beta-lactamase induction
VNSLIKRPSWGALLLALIPFLAMCFSVALWDRVEPMPLGIPFNLFWLICWIVLTTLCMWAAYRIEARRSRMPVPRERDEREGGEQDDR